MAPGPRKYVVVAANGHVMVNWPDAGHNFYNLLCLWLRVRYRLRGEGQSVFSPDDIILPDLVGEDIRLSRGWDNWSGYYLLASDEAGDRLLKQTFGR